MKKLGNKANEFLKKIDVSIISKALAIVLLIAGLICVYIAKENTLNQTASTVNESNTNQKEGYHFIENEKEPETNELEPIENNENSNIKEQTNPTVPDANTQTVPKTTIEPQTSTNSTIPKENEEITTKSADAEIMAYMSETESYFSNTNLKEEVKSRFITIVDFLFYNGKIKGYTLNDLSAKAKLQVLKIALSIDTKIDKHFPGYKESITKTTGKIYTNVKNKIIESYLNLTTKICTYDKATCDSAKKDFQDMKKAFSITWNVIKSLVSSGTDHLKEWYEIFSGKTN